jgi:hypothetical protein
MSIRRPGCTTTLPRNAARIVDPLLQQNSVLFPERMENGK